MSAIKLNSSGGGSITISPASTASTLTLTAPAQTGTIGLDGPAFSAYSAVSGQSVSAATPTKVIFGLENFDTNNNFSSSRFTPTVAGYYQVNWSVSSNLSQQRIFASLYKNGSEYARSTDLAGTAAIGYSTTGSSLLYCNGSTDYLEVYVYLQNSATVGDNGGLTTYFNGSMVRAA